jgi:hypothetical protein
MSDYDYEIIERIAVLSETYKGWTKELTKISWNGQPAKYDLRMWHHKEGKIRKGVTLTDEELNNLKIVLNNMEF